MASKLIENLLAKISKGKYANKRPFFKSGDTLNVYAKVKDGEKERVQLFKGIVIKIQNAGNYCSFTVRKTSNGVGVEKTFMLASPSIDKIERIRKGKVRRARLFYLRKLMGKAAHVKSDHWFTETEGAKGSAKKSSSSTKGSPKPTSPRKEGEDSTEGSEITETAKTTEATKANAPSSKEASSSSDSSNKDKKSKKLPLPASTKSGTQSTSPSQE